MKRKILLFFSVLLVCLVFVSCTSQTDDLLPKEITAGTWIRTDENGFVEELNLSINGHFSYYYPDAGNAVGNYDLYDKYTYDKDDNIITLINCEDNKKTIKIPLVGYDEKMLKLKIDGKECIFTKK